MKIKLNLINNIVLTVLGLLTLFPVYFMLVTSFKSNSEYLVNYWGIPRIFQLSNYLEAWQGIGMHVFYSLGYSLVNFIIVFIVASLAGYSFARFKFPGKNFLFILCLGVMMIPGIMTLLSQFIEVRDFGLLKTPLALWVGWASIEAVSSMLIMRIFFENISSSLFEAAYIDGAHDLDILIKIAYPLSLPALGTIAMLDFLFSWNDIFWPRLVLESDVQTVSNTVLSATSISYGVPYAAYIIVIVPVLVLFIFCVRYFINGFTVSIEK